MEELSPAAPDAAEAARGRLRADLKTAMKARDALSVRVFRALLAAVDDAQAPPAGDRHDRYAPNAFEDGAAEVARLRLTEDDVRAVFTREAADRRSAAAQMQRLGKADHAEALLQEAEAIEERLAPL